MMVFLYSCSDSSSSSRNDYYYEENLFGDNQDGDISFRSSKKAVKTTATCDKCSCAGYIGIKHSNGTYEGNCLRTDQWGHTCNHSPKHHGLSEY